MPRKTHPKVKCGDEFGRLVVDRLYLGKSGGRSCEFADVRCRCGATLPVPTSRLKNGETASCGCLRREKTGDRFRKHGLSGHPLRLTWTNMIQRCTNPAHPQYLDYGGRGIRVCRDWDPGVLGVDAALANFLDWAGRSGHRPGLTLDRRENDGGYGPSNCRWATMAEQARNKRSTRVAAAFGESKCLTDWAADPRCVVPYHTLRRRHAAGWDHEKMLTTASAQRRPPRQ